ncbi:MAG TPA: putative nucleotidyltransferase substrate binding domain-containing protein [Phycicoccus sp.]|nr:putative nucleotidyltransferase substrate binding domain-containing protein [Phycicoccus sp.]
MALDVELAEVRDFLARHAPFDALPAEVLAELPRQFTVEYHRRGRAIIGLGKDNHSLFVIRSGAVDILDEQGNLMDRCEVGDVFGSVTLVLGNPSIHDVVAIEDTLVLALPEERFRRLCERHPDFDHFFDIQRAHRMRGAVATLQDSETTHAMLRTGVRDLVRREPITVGVDATIRAAAQVMSRQGASCLLVVDDDRLVGIVTDRDLRNRVVAQGVPTDLEVSEVMTADPVMAQADSLAFEALLEMVGRNIHHLPIVEGGRPVGVITTTDLMRMVQASPIYLVGDIKKQIDVAGVAAASARLPAIVESLVAQDASAEDIGRVVTAIGDAVERRLLTLAEQDLAVAYGPPPVPYVWVCLGSRARFEQALGADQDNALIISDEAREEDLAWFALLAEWMTAALVRCGYPECKGKVMATNPDFRRTVREWRRELVTWLTRPVPEAVLQASIVFDMRPVHGDVELFAEVQREVLERAPDSTRFLAHLARAATLNEPPLGFFRGFVLAKEGDHRDTLDIKRGGIGAVVELARVHALALGSPATNTHARIAAAVAAGIITPEKAADLKDAFEFISYVRLRHQASQVRAGREVDNRVNPAQLSSFDKRHLREAFAIVRAAQAAMASRYPTSFM